MKKGQVRHVFPGSNTTRGFHSFYKEGLEKMERVFILKGGPGTGKSTLMRRIAYNMSERGYDIELWQCSSDNDSIDGVIIPLLGIAVVDGTSPHMVDPSYPGAVDEIVNLGNYWNQEILRDYKDEIKYLTKQISGSFGEAYACLGKSGELYSKICRSNGLGLSLEAIQETAQDLIMKIFHNDTANIRRFFASAMTPAGLVGYGQEITEFCQHRYILNGGISNNVNQVLQLVAASAMEKGHNLDLYYNPLNPDALEILVLPDLKIALVDSNAPDLQPLVGDVLVDLLPQTGEAVGKEFQEDIAERERLLAEAENYITAAHSLHDRLEEYYIKAMDFESIDAVAKSLFTEIWGMAAEKEKITK